MRTAALVLVSNRRRCLHDLREYRITDGKPAYYFLLRISKDLRSFICGRNFQTLPSSTSEKLVTSVVTLVTHVTLNYGESAGTYLVKASLNESSL